MPQLYFSSPPLPHYIASGYTVTEPGRRHPSRSSIGVFDLLIVHEGCLYIAEEEQSYELAGGQALILRPDCYHYSTQACRELTRYHWLHFQTLGAWGMREEEDLGLPFPPSPDRNDVARIFTMQTFEIRLPQWQRLLQPAPIMDSLEELERLEQEAHRSGSAWQQQRSFQELLRLLSLAPESAAGTPAAMVADLAATYLRQHYSEDFNAQTLGEALNFHPVYIARCMQRVYGMPPSGYLLRCRIEQAKRLLLQTDLPVTRIAEEVGFQQPSYFTSCFTREEGMTPRDFRKQFVR